MKTELIYPNGLKVTIEFEDMAHLEVLESNPAADLIKRVAELEKDNNELAARVRYLQGLPVQPVVPVLKEEKNYVHNVTVKTAGFKPKEKKKPTFPDRKCHYCGQMFHPTGPRGNKCEICKGNEQQPAPTSDLDKTLQEIEENKKKPYEFLKGGQI